MFIPAVERRLPMAAALFLVLATACDGPTPTVPDAGEILVSVQTSGGDPDADGYEVVVGSDMRRLLLGPTGSVVIDGLETGTYTVALAAVAENCTVTGANPLTVTVATGTIVIVKFEITCATTGIEITTRTSGSLNPNGHQVMIDNQKSLSWSRMARSSWAVSRRVRIQ